MTVSPRKSHVALALLFASTSAAKADTDAWLPPAISWTSPTSWSLNRVPGPADDAQIVGFNNTPMATIDASLLSIQLNSLYVNAPDATLYFHSIQSPVIDVEAGYVSFGAGLSNTTIEGLGSHTSVGGNLSNPMSNVTLAGSLIDYNCPITGSLTFAGGVLHVGTSGNGFVPGAVSGNGTLQGTGQIIFDGPTYISGGGSLSSFQMPTIPAGITLTNGTGEIQLWSNVTNYGSIVVNPGHYLFLTPTRSFVNAGNLTLNQATFVVYDWTTTNSLNTTGHVSSSNGKIVIDGNLTVPGGAFDIDATFGAPIVVTGNVDASSITASAGSTISFSAPVNIYPNSPTPPIAVNFTAPNVALSANVGSFIGNGTVSFAGNLTLGNNNFNVGTKTTLIISGGLLDGIGQFTLFGGNQTDTPFTLRAAPGGTLTIGAGINFVTNATSNNTNFALGSPDTSVINYANISINNSTATFNINTPNWTNYGTINLSNGNLSFNANITTASLTNINHTGGNLLLYYMTLDNSNATFSLDAARGAWTSVWSTVRGGTIIPAGGSLNAQYGSNITLDGVTLSGDFSSAGLQSFYFKNGLTLSNATLAINRYLSSIGTDAIAGTATINMENNPAYYPVIIGSSNGTLTIGPGITIRTHTFGGAIGNVINQGFISSELAGANITFSGTNQGTISATNGGQLSFSSLVNSGQVTADATTVTLAGPVTNTGNISLGNSTLLLAYYDPNQTLGNFSHTGPTLFAGSVSDVAAPIDLSNTIFGPATISYGTTFSNVTLTSSNAPIIFPALSTFSGTLAANATIPAGSKLTSYFLALQNANVSLQAVPSSPATLSVAEISGTGTIRFDGSSSVGSQNMLSSDQYLTIDPGVSVRTGTGGGILFAFNQTVNYGLISVETPGSTIAYAGSPYSALNNKGLVSITAGTMFLPTYLINSGTIAVASNGTLVIPSFTPIGGTLSRTGGTVAYTGNLTGTGNTVDLNNAFWGPIALDRSYVANLTLTSTSGPVSVVYTQNPNGDFSSATFFTNVTLASDIIIQPGGTLYFSNTVALNNRTIHLNGSNSANATLILNYGTFTGNGTFSFDGGSQFNSITNVYQIPAGITFQTGTAGGTLTQASQFAPNLPVDGTISAQTPAATITLSLPTSPLLIQSDGVIQAINGGNVVINGFTTNSGHITIDAASSVTVTSPFTQSGGVLSGNGTLKASAIAGAWIIPITVKLTSTGLSTVSSLTLAGSTNNWTGKLDIGPAGVDISSASAKISTVSNQVAQAYAGGTWSGTSGITSSSLAQGEGVAVLTGADYIAATNKSIFHSGRIRSADLLLTTALLGDANLDNKVDLNDLNIVLQNFGQPSLSWTHGNFDYAPTIDLTDLADVLNNLGQSFTAAPAQDSGLKTQDPTPTPEPATLALLTLAAPLLLKRRR